MVSFPRNSWKTLLGILVTAAFQSSAFSQAAVDQNLNLLTNGDFTKDTAGWELLSFGHQGKATVVAPGQGMQDTLKPRTALAAETVDPADFHDGKPSLKIENISDDDTVMKQKVTVKPATRYRMSGWIKTKGVEWKLAKGKRGASFCVMGAFEASQPIPKTKGWTHVTFEIASGTRSEIFVGARLGMYASPVRGTAWFSDITLNELGPSGR